MPLNMWIHDLLVQRRSQDKTCVYHLGHGPNSAGQQCTWISAVNVRPTHLHSCINVEKRKAMGFKAAALFKSHDKQIFPAFFFKRFVFMVAHLEGSYLPMTLRSVRPLPQDLRGRAPCASRGDHTDGRASLCNSLENLRIPQAGLNPVNADST